MLLAVWLSIDVAISHTTWLVSSQTSVSVSPLELRLLTLSHSLIMVGWGSHEYPTACEVFESVIVVKSMMVAMATIIQAVCRSDHIPTNPSILICLIKLLFFLVLNQFCLITK